MKVFLAFFRALAITAVSLPGLSRAALLINEPFSYASGSLVTNSGGLWQNHSGTTGDVQVVSGKVILDRNLTEDVSTSLPGQPYSSSTNIFLYASFKVNFSGLPLPAGDYFAHFKNAGTTFRAKVFALTSGAGVGQFRIGVSGSDNIAAATNAVNLNTNADYRIYVRYVLSNAVTRLWVDPTSEASPSITATDASPATLTSFALREDPGMGILSLDELRIGTSFAGVFQAPPTNPPVITQQPIDTAAAVGGVANFTVTATGTAPLSYQWKFFGANLPGATATNLLLTSVTLAQAGLYSVTVSNTAGSTNSATANLTVIGPSVSNTLTLVTYNVKGNFASDWSTNAAQVQAIARELQYLSPDIIALNEIPNGLRYEMTNWMIAFFPTYSLAVSSNTDGAIRLGFISRYPFTRTQSWLDSASLTNFGYNGTYTRDLFEAEILVPGASEPLHVFTTHLKSGSDADSQDRRAAECSAVSNFFATAFIPTNGSHAYVLTGDLNEDIGIPMSHSNQPIQRLISAPTGLKLTTPVNPFTSVRFTHSIQGSLDARFDYIMPAGVLSSNIVASQVFRTDQLPPPLPPNLNSNDDMVASDHLPVVMVLNYPDPALHVSLTANSQTSVVTWPALVGRKFRVETSTNLTTWTVAASNLVALSSPTSWTNANTTSLKHFRVVRTP